VALGFLGGPWALGWPGLLGPRRVQGPKKSPRRVQGPKTSLRAQEPNSPRRAQGLKKSTRAQQEHKGFTIAQGPWLYSDATLTLLDAEAGEQFSLLPLRSNIPGLTLNSYYYLFFRCSWPLCSRKCEDSPMHDPECRIIQAGGQKVT
jgi:hypothetical protein